MSQVHNKEWDRTIMVGLLSEKRLSTYLAATDGVLDTAFELYAWNTQLAGMRRGTDMMTGSLSLLSILGLEKTWIKLALV